MWLSLDNLSIVLGQKQIIHDLSLTLAEGDIACLLGPSGCGKTTVLRSIAGFQALSKGRISLADQVLDNGKKQVPAHLRQVGLVFQDYALFAHLSVAANIAFGLHGWPKSERQQRVETLLALIGLTDYAHAYTRDCECASENASNCKRNCDCACDGERACQFTCECACDSNRECACECARE